MRLASNPLLLAVYAVAASMTALILRYLTFHFDQYTQNFYRYLVGAVVLLVLSVVTSPHELRRLLRSRRGMAGVALIAIVGGVLGQALIVEGVARTSAVLLAMIPTAAVPLSIGLGALLFKDEREVVRGRGFLLGAPLALLGAVGLALGHPHGNAQYTQGVEMVIVATIIGSGVVQVSKRMVLSFHFLSVVTLTTVIACPFFLVGALLWGHPEQMWRGPALPTVIMLVSGAYGLLVGGALYYFCLHKFGLIRVIITGLAAPVFTGIWGYLFLREGMSPREMAAAAVLLAGCYLVVRGKREPALASDTAGGT